MTTLFVIPHQGRIELLHQTLQSIAAQKSFQGIIEVVVVSKEATLQLEDALVSAENMLIPIHCHVVPASLTISAQRNLGVEISGADFLAFIDADIALAPDWLTCMQRLLEADTRRVIVSAVQRCSAAAGSLERIRTDQSNVHVDADLQHMPGRNLFMRRTHFDIIGGFPEHLSTCEDYHFTGQAARLGSLHYSTGTHYVHLGEDKQLLPMFQKEIWRGASNLHSIAGRPVGCEELPSFLVPLGMLSSVIVLVVSALTFQFLPFMLALACFLIPPVLFSLRLKRRTRSASNLVDLCLFYGAYFTARGVGMLFGLGQSLKRMTVRSNEQRL